MKSTITLVISIIFSLHVNAQSPVVDTNTCLYIIGDPDTVYIDTVYSVCDSQATSNFNINIEPTPGNIWQKGTTFKFGNADPRDTLCAIITDTVNNYPVNNYSAFHFLLPETPQSIFNYNYSYYLKFWHKYETDSLLDGCWLEFSSDSGNNWHSFDSLLYGDIYRYCNLYNQDHYITPSGIFDTLIDGRKAWSGSSSGWHYTALQFNVFISPVKGTSMNNVNAIRFVFQSDSIDNNKPGWIIDEFSTGYADVTDWGGLNDYAYAQLPVYPNPSNSGIFKISYPSNYVKGIIQVYNIYGQKILETELSTTLDISTFSNGMYYYKAFFDNKIYSGVLHKN